VDLAKLARALHMLELDRLRPGELRDVSCAPKKPKRLPRYSPSPSCDRVRRADPEPVSHRGTFPLDDAHELLSLEQPKGLLKRESRPKRRWQIAQLVRRTDEREGLEPDSKRSRSRSISKHDVDEPVLQGRVERFANGPAERVNLIDE